MHFASYVSPATEFLSPSLPSFQTTMSMTITMTAALFTWPSAPAALPFKLCCSPFLNPTKCRRGFRLHPPGAGTGRFRMFLKTKPLLKDGVLSFNGTEALNGIPDNVVITPLSESSAFLGVTSTTHTTSSSRLVFKLGIIK